VNTLKSPEAYRLRQWIDLHREDAQSTPPDQLAVKLSEELGFTVTLSNVNTALRDLGVVLPRKRKADQVEARLANIEADLHQTFARLNEITGSDMLSLSSRVTSLEARVAWLDPIQSTISGDSQRIVGEGAPDDA